MEKYDFDIDVELFDDESVNGFYLTNVRSLSDEEKIEVTFHEFENGKVKKQSIVTLHDNYHNNHKVLKQKYESVFKLIELNDINLYNRIDSLMDEADEYKSLYRFNELISTLSLLGAVGFGYVLSTSDSLDSSVLLSLAFLAGAIIIGINAKKKYIMNKHIYDVDCSRLFDEIELNSKDYVRIRRQGDMNEKENSNMY